MFHCERNNRDLREIISKASNYKERAKFPSRIKTFVSQSFQTDVYVTADLYQAKRQDNVTK